MSFLHRRVINSVRKIIKLKNWLKNNPKVSYVDYERKLYLMNGTDLSQISNCIKYTFKRCDDLYLRNALKTRAKADGIFRVISLGFHSFYTSKMDLVEEENNFTVRFLRLKKLYKALEYNLILKEEYINWIDDANPILILDVMECFYCALDLIKMPDLCEFFVEYIKPQCMLSFLCLGLENYIVNTDYLVSFRESINDSGYESREAYTLRELTIMLADSVNIFLHFKCI